MSESVFRSRSRIDGPPHSARNCCNHNLNTATGSTSSSRSAIEGSATACTVIDATTVWLSVTRPDTSTDTIPDR